MVAVRASDLVSPLKNRVPLRAGDRSALAVAGTERIRAGEPVVFLKVVAVAAAQVTRDGQVRAQGSPCARATLGPLEDWLDAQAGPGVIAGIAERAVLDPEYVKAERDRLLTAEFMIRVVVLMTLMPGAQAGDVVTALAGDLAMVPWSRLWRPASERACLDWRNALGPAPLEELQAGAGGGTGRAPGTGRGGPGHRPQEEAEAALPGRDAGEDAGHAGEPGGVRDGGHGGRVVGVAVPAGAAAE